MLPKEKFIMNKMKLTIERVRDLEALEAVRSEWDGLLEKNEVKTIELAFDWQISFWKHFNKNAELFVLVVKESGSLVAIAPFKLVNTRVLGIKIRTIEFIAAMESNYQDFIIGAKNIEVLECIFDYLVSIRGSWDVLRLRHVLEVSTTSLFLMEKYNLFPLRKIAQTDQCIYLDLDTSWEEYKKSLGKERRHRMNNRMRRIEKDVGQINLRNSLTPEQFETDLLMFFHLHRLRWDGTSTPSQFNDPRFCDFYLEAGLQLLAKGQFNISTLDAGSATLAQLLSFTFHDQVLIQLIAYDPKYYPYSPMLVLQELFVEKSLSENIKLIDWGTYYPWKELWANCYKKRVNLIIYPMRFFPYLIYCLTRMYGFFRKIINENLQLMNFLRKIRNRMKSIKNKSQQALE
jgi:CelD/BcsL family acetyltransferase involved in cellulose biosynthesis